MIMAVDNRKKAFFILLGAVLLSGALFLLIRYGFEALFSDAATRLAYQIRDEAAALRRAGGPVRVFEHWPRSAPDGIRGDYRIEIVETRTSPRPGHRSIGVARNLTEPAWYATSYHLNFVEVPRDLTVSHRKGEPTRVTLELRDDRVLLTDLR
jgi:hypothetical protein